MPDLAAAAEKGIAWIENHRDQFSPRRGRNANEQTMLLTTFAELILTLTLLGRDTALRQRLAPVVAWAWNAIDRGQLLIDLTSAKPDLVEETVGIYANFAQNGHHDTRLEAWLTHLANTQFARGLELTPWRQVAFDYNLNRLGLRGPAALPGGSWLGALPDPWTVSVATAYSMTHEVFYLTDFGRSPDNLSTEIREYLWLWLPAWERCFQHPENLDLIAELTMTAACAGIGALSTPQLLVNRQLTDGSFPGSPGAGDHLPSPKGDQLRRRFLTQYHATLVSVLAFTYPHWTLTSTPM